VEIGGAMRVVVAGAGLAGRRLIARLAADHHDVTAIDLNREVCELISSKLGVASICGNATDITTLEESEIGKAAVAVALMRQSADNLAFSLLAKSAGVGRIIARMANPKYREAYEQAGVTSIIDITGLFLDQLLLEIERPQVHEVATFGAGQGIIFQVVISKNARAAGKTVREITSERRFPRDWLIAGIFRERDGQLIIPTGEERLFPWDQILLCGAAESTKEAADYFEITRGLRSVIGRRAKASLPDKVEQQAQNEIDTAIEKTAETDEDSPD